MPYRSCLNCRSAPPSECPVYLPGDIHADPAVAGRAMARTCKFYKHEELCGARHEKVYLGRNSTFPQSTGTSNVIYKERNTQVAEQMDTEPPTRPRLTDGKCPFCIAEGKTSSVHSGYSTRTLMYAKSYYDECGQHHCHDSNITNTSYRCSNGHTWSQSDSGTCKCGWLDKEPK